MGSKTTVTTRTVFDATSAAAIASNNMSLVNEVLITKETETPNGIVKSTFIAQPNSTLSVVESAGGQTSSQGNQTIQVVQSGTAAEAGKLNYNATGYLPNIYLNLKNHSFNNNNLLFRLKTGTNLSTVGSTTTNWAGDTAISSFTLTDSGAVANLQVVEAYGIKFYKLANGKVIQSYLTTTPRRSPSYTVLVFGLGKDGAVGSSQGDILKLLTRRFSSVHKFIENPTSNPWLYSNQGNSFYNFSLTTPLIDRSGSNDAERKIFRACFAGSTLNIPKYFARGQEEAGKFNIYEAGLITKPSFVNDFNNWKENSSSRNIPYSNKIIIDDAFTKFKLPTLGSAPNALANNTTPVAVTIDNGSSTTYETFSMFFVEMFSYFNGITGSVNNVPFEELVIETRINNQTVYKTTVPFKRDADLSSDLRYNIALSSNMDGSEVDSTKAMFLFDYLHGFAQDEASMRKQSKNIIESLAYDYRSLMIKSSTDLQIGSNAKTLLFPLTVPHPFLNIYAREKS